jgi:hypothetical protein
MLRQQGINAELKTDFAYSRAGWVQIEFFKGNAGKTGEIKTPPPYARNNQTRTSKYRPSSRMT